MGTIGPIPYRGSCLPAISCVASDYRWAISSPWRADALSSCPASHCGAQKWSFALTRCTTLGHRQRKHGKTLLTLSLRGDRRRVCPKTQRLRLERCSLSAFCCCCVCSPFVRCASAGRRPLRRQRAHCSDLAHSTLLWGEGEASRTSLHAQRGTQSVGHPSVRKIFFGRSPVFRGL